MAAQLIDDPVPFLPQSLHAKTLVTAKIDVIVKSKHLILANTMAVKI